MSRCRVVTLRPRLPFSLHFPLFSSLSSQPILFPCIMTESPSPFNIETWRRRNERRVSATSSVITPSEISRVSGERRTHQQAFSDCVGCLGLSERIMVNEEQESPSYPLDPNLVSRNQIDQALSWARSLKLSKEQINELDTLSKVNFI
jgi:hypothetical protein